MPETFDPLAEFIEAASVPRGSSHASGTLDRAETVRAAHPDLATRSIHAAAILGEDPIVHRFLADGREHATAKGGPYGWDPLTHLCFSRYLRLVPERSEGFVRAATALLNAGASANTGWYETIPPPAPTFESVLYGAAGIAHHAGLTRLLLDRGADPNDGEVTYHTPEGWDNRALEELLQSDLLTPDSLATMLLRKADWHDLKGVRLLLERGANPNRLTQWGKTALHNALLSDNAIEIIELLLDHGADPRVKGTRPEVARSAANLSPASIAARRGRGDALKSFERRQIPIELDGVERLIAACARDDGAVVRSIAERNPEWVKTLQAQGGKFLAEFAGNGNTDGVRWLLDLGVDVRSLYVEGDGYFGTARNSTALHVAAWRARHDTVRLLLERGAPVEAVDGAGHTALALAVRACVDSYWTHRRSPESIRALLAAGARLQGIAIPCGYREADALLEARSG